MRGDEFRHACVDAIDRIRRATGGKSDVLVMTTMPGPKEWDTRAELGEAGRKAARERNAGLADTDRAFHEAGKTDPNRLFAKDPQRGTPDVHLGPEGQRVVAETVMQAIEAAGK